jgi:acyl dehydratase
MDSIAAAAGRHGRFLEDFRVGDVYRHWPGRTITEADNIQFSLPPTPRARNSAGRSSTAA